jgi:ABC-type glycerol-3-phosphate transport system substrate-binding protein
MRKTLLWALCVVMVAGAGLAACGGGTPTEEAPQASLGTVVVNPHPASLEGKTVLLRWNGKHNGDNLLNRVAELLVEQVQDVKVLKMWELDPETAAMSESMETSERFVADMAAQQPDLVIAAQCD